MSIQAAVPPPRAPGFQAKGGPRGQREQKEKKYGTPLPILLPSSPLHPSFSPTRSTLFPSVIAPTCTGKLDAASASVWVEDPEHMEILFNRGFFGKGTLSRSDPNWRSRRVELSKGGSALAAEQIREKRRKERKQFKIDRAAAMLDAAKKAEAVITSGQLPEGVEFVAEGPIAIAKPAEGAGGEQEAETVAESVVEVEEQVSEERAQSPSTTDYTTLLPDGAKLTAQTFLVRPTRPDANRNRGKRAFKRRPGPPSAAPPSTEQNQATPPTDQPPAPQPGPQPQPESESEDEIEEMEHLQLSFQEAGFLSSLGVLKIYDPATEAYIPQGCVLRNLLTPPSESLYPDDPFLVSYAAYHHYRSLGWCVRDGIKFCADWLLYRRGPVFSHSAFSIVVVPVYNDENDQATSPYGTQHRERMSWKWMNTIMRVNSLVMKTIIVAYVTIPALDSFSDNVRLDGGGLDPRKFTMKDLMKRYTVREVSLMRFGPARRRD